MYKIQPGTSVILFDGVCNFCNATVNFIIKHDKKNRFRFASLQSEVGKQLLEQFNLNDFDLDSIVLIHGCKLHMRSGAVLRISRYLDRAYFLLYGFLIIPSPLRDTIYKYVSNNRYNWFGKSDSCMIPSLELKEKFIS
jgi:predicted DCC family thiol-disulfide oxidoreductase YuxK